MSGVQTIERAFALLRALAVGPAGVTDLAERVHLPKSTVARLLTALETEGVVQQDEAGGEYRLGGGLADLAGSSAPGRNLVAAARPHLIELMSASGETAGISVPDATDVYYLDHVETVEDVQVRSWTGENAPMHTVPSGLVLLAHAPVDFVDAYLARPLVASTDRTVVDPDRIRERLAEIRATGYAWVFGEFAEEINSVAAPVRGADGTVASAIHVHGPAYRFPEPDQHDKLGRLVVDAANRLAEDLF